ncbi:hypothetical protein ACGFY6_20635 [Streptomyces sp. NPDC048387]|uniref:hypothetical protein n=1 Tax=Streptomyces sp. NPDC048387 TaxID=3365542 RepID=UPI00371A19F7
MGAASEFEYIVADMKSWHPPTQSQIQAENAFVDAWDELQSLPRTKEQILAELEAGPKTSTGATDHAKINELRDNLDGLDDAVHQDRDGKTWVDQGLISKAQQALRDAEALAEAARVSPVKRMRAVFNNSAERAEVAGTSKVDQVGTQVLAEPAGGRCVRPRTRSPPAPRGPAGPPVLSSGKSVPDRTSAG